MSKHQSPVRIVIADDHPLVRDGLRRLFDLQHGLRVVGEAADGVEALQRVKTLKPDVLLLDLTMPRMDGLEVLRELVDAAAKVRTIVLTASIEGDETVQALRLGARGVVLKDTAMEQLYKGIHAVMKGDLWVGQDRVGDLVHALLHAERASEREARPGFALTEREREVMAAVLEGASNREIGKDFGLSEQTVKNHVSHIFDKLGVSNRLELALYAMHHGLMGHDSRGPDRSARRRPRTKRPSPKK